MVTTLEENWALNAPQRQVPVLLSDSGDRAAMRPSFDSMVGLVAAVSSRGLDPDMVTIEILRGRILQFRRSRRKRSWKTRRPTLIPPGYQMFHRGIGGDAI